MIDGQNKVIEVKSMPGINRYSPDRIIDEIGACVELGIKSFAPFPGLADSVKDRLARESANPDGLYLRTIAEIKRQFPEVLLMTDVGMDP